MQKLIKNVAVVDDSWTLLAQADSPEVLEAVPGKKLLLPLSFWRDFRENAENYGGEIALWLDSSEGIKDVLEVFADELHQLPVIALNFPAFADGRAYTTARELRQKQAYQGEIRAIGDVLRDQLFYMSRCGFDSFALRHDQDIDTCLAALNDFSTNYQSTVTEPTPLFRRR